MTRGCQDAPGIAPTRHRCSPAQVGAGFGEVSMPPESGLAAIRRVGDALVPPESGTFDRGNPVAPIVTHPQPSEAGASDLMHLGCTDGRAGGRRVTVLAHHWRNCASLIESSP